MENYTSFDFITVFLIFLSSLFAYLRGLIREVILISNWLISIFLAYLISPATFKLVSEINFIKSVFSDSCEIIMIISFLAGFIFSLIVVSFLTSNMSRLVEASIFNEVNKILGLCFGICRGALIAVVFLIVHNQIWSQSEGWQTVIQSNSNKITLNMQKKILQSYPKNIPDWLIGNYESLVTNCLIK